MRNLTQKDFQVEDTSACTNDTFVSTLFVQKKEAAYKTKISIKKYIISRAETSILTNSARNERNPWNHPFDYQKNHPSRK